MMELMAKAEERPPYTVVALQEADRMNVLTNEMKLSLRELDLGLKVITYYPITKCRNVIMTVVFRFIHK